MLIKHWDAVSAFFVGLWNKITGAFTAAFDWIKNLLGGVSNKVLGVIAVFLPFIGIPALVIKNWETIQAFFTGLWVRITALFTAVWTGIKNFFAGLWAGIAAEFANAWNGILSFFNSVWNGIVQTAASVANWFSSVWNAVADGFAGAWLWIKDLFTSIWESIKGVVMSFVEWLSPVIDAIIAPFKGIGDAIGGIIGTVGGWFGKTVELGKTELAKAGENKTKNIAAEPVGTAFTSEQINGSLADPRVAAALGYTNSLTAPAAIVPPAIATASSAITPPAFTAAQTATGTGADATGGAGKSLLNEHLAAASRKGIAATDMSMAASGAFMDAGASVVSVIDMPDFDSAARTNFQEAMPAQSAAFQPPWTRNEPKPAKSEPRTVKIENLYLQADDTLDLLNFVRQLEHAVFQPVEAAI
jgi:hypothetical protein